MGLSWHSLQPWGALQVDFLHDVDGASRGNELRLGYGYAWRSGDLTLRPNLTLGLRDAKLNNYYYGVREDEATESRDATDSPWVTIVWDDPVNLMSYVTFVFQDYFGYSLEKAETLMLRVHHEGKAVVSAGNRESMERDVLAMQGYNLWASMEEG